MTLRTLIQRAWWYISGNEPPTHREALREMYRGLDIKADATSFAMARADELYERLEAEIANNEALCREAENFMREKDEMAAQRCTTLRIQSDQKIEKLKAEYAQAQQTAEQKVTQFQQNQREVESRQEVLPEIEERQHIIAMEEGIQKKLASFSMENPQRAFDQIDRELHIRERQLANRQLLASDPNAELDHRIRQAVGERKIQTAMDELRKKIAAESDVVEGEVVRTNEIDRVAEARNILEAPRYSGLGITSSVDRRQSVAVRQLASGGGERQ